MFLRSPEYCKIHDFHIKSRNQAYFMIYNISMIFIENDEFMEIQSGDSEKLQKDMKRHWFYKAWRIRAAPDQKTIILRKFWKIPSVSHASPGLAVKSVGFIENSNPTLPRHLGQTNGLLILFTSSGHWCGLACQI